MNKQITIEQEWQEFKAHIYPGKPDDTEQIRQLRACWHAAFLDCFSVIHDISRLPEGIGAKLLLKLQNEAMAGCEEFIKKEKLRQAARKDLGKQAKQ